MPSGLASSILHGQFVRGKATKYNRMHRAKAGAGEHGLDSFGHHRHIDDDAVALSRYLWRAKHQPARPPGCGVRTIGEISRLVWVIGAVIDDRSLLASTCFDVAVYGVPAGVGLAIGKPFVEIVALDLLSALVGASSQLDGVWKPPSRTLRGRPSTAAYTSAIAHRVILPVSIWG